MALPSIQHSTRILLRHCHPSIRGGQSTLLCFPDIPLGLVCFVWKVDISSLTCFSTAFSGERKACSIVSVLFIPVMTIEKLLPPDLQESTPQILQEPLVYEVLEEAPLLSNDEKLKPGWCRRSSRFFAPITDPLFL